MGSLTGALVIASIDPDKLKQLAQLERFRNVANGVEHVDAAAAETLQGVAKVTNKTPDVPKPYEHDMNSSKPHDPDLMRNRVSGPVTIDGTVYESGQQPRKLRQDEQHVLTLVEKEGGDNTEMLKPRQNKQSQNTAPVNPENEHLALKAGVSLTAFAGLAFGALKYYEAQREYRRELTDAYSLAVNVNNYADNPEDRLSRYTTTVQKYPELDGAIKLFEGARASAAKDGFSYQEVETLKRVVANTTEAINNNELASVALPNHRDADQNQYDRGR